MSGFAQTPNEKTQLAKQIKADHDIGSTVTKIASEMLVKRVDLNADDTPEYLVYGIADICGAGQCTHFIYRRVGAKFLNISGYGLTGTTYKIERTRTNGYLNISISEKAFSGGGVTVYKFDGSSYRPLTSKRSKQPAVIPGGDWNSFWLGFSAAVRKRNRAALRTMMSPRFDSGGDGPYSPDAWIKLMDRNSFWPMTQRAVSSGTKPSRANDGRAIRITNDMYLFFEIGPDARWRWAGVVGD